jgi:Tol biopolymer transport system component
MKDAAMARPRFALAGVLIIASACSGSPSPSATPGVTAVASPAATLVPSPTTVIPTASPTSAPREPSGDVLFFRSSGVEGASNGSAWLAPVAGGPPIELGPAAEASWAADGRSIHLVTQDASCVPTLKTVSVDGSQVGNPVRTGLRTEDGAFAWSPDGGQVVFSRFHNGGQQFCGSQGGAYGPDALVQDVMVMDADGSHQRVLVPMVLPSRPISWSPDGTRIAFASVIGDANLNLVLPFVLRVSDGKQTQLTAAPFEGLTSPRWSPDGTRLAFSFFLDGVKKFGLVPAAGGARLDLGGAENTQDLAWSPDSGTIAAAFDVDVNGALNPGGIVLDKADASGSVVLTLTDIEVFSMPPSWSPAGDWIAYVTTVSGGIGLVRADGSSQRGLPVIAGVQWVVWQPNP